METILRSEEMAEIRLLPVRHHSPACALHVQHIINAWEPDMILIEGPDNANDWISVMVHEDTKAPFAVYYSYDDTTGVVSPDKEKYKCYYPFLDYSPELVALRTGAKMGISTAFIDMPYGMILAASKEGKGLLKEAEKSNYNDDYLMTRSAYVKLLCEKTGMRSFDEFWEKYFEIDGLSMDSEIWFHNLLVHCELSREYSSEEELRAEGCLHRETYMAKRILEEANLLHTQVKDLQRNSKILVITGGFHTSALKVRLLTEQERTKEGVETPVQEKLQKVPAKDQGVYMMPYSMEAADALNGYASGMPYTGFYQTVWEHLQINDQKEMQSEEKEQIRGAYDEAVFQYIVNCGKAVRSKEGGISTYDEICAYNMTKGLAALRGKEQPGAYELQDAVLSNFIKGEYTIATDFAMQQLRRQMTGKNIGELCRNANEPPILQDFREKCKQYGLNITSTVGEEVVLSIFAKKKHRKTSMFLHQLTFLDTAFTQRLKGPNLQSGRDRNLMREIWKYKWNAQVMASLIDASVYGATVEEAVISMVKEKLKQELPAEEAALIFTQVFEMGLDKQMEGIYESVHDAILKDTSFYSLTNALKKLTILQELSGLYQSKLQLEDLMSVCCRKVTGLLPVMTRVKEEDMAQCMEALKVLYQVTGKTVLPDAKDLKAGYLQALQKMDEDREIQAGVHGCVHGILYGSGVEDIDIIERVCQGYLAGTKEQSMRTAMFFRGLFFAAKDLVFVGEQFVTMLNTFLQEVDTESFMKLLPEMRMAFTYFTPNEVDRIAASVAGLYGKGKEDILEKKAVSEELLKYSKKLDEIIMHLVSEG